MLFLAVGDFQNQLMLGWKSFWMDLAAPAVVVPDLANDNKRAYLRMLPRWQWALQFEDWLEQPHRRSVPVWQLQQEEDGGSPHCLRAAFSHTNNILYTLSLPKAAHVHTRRFQYKMLNKAPAFERKIIRRQFWIHHFSLTFRVRQASQHENVRFREPKLI